MSTTPPFSELLKAAVGGYGGQTKAAALCGVTTRSLRYWMAGKAVPSAAVQVGVLSMLKAKSRSKPRHRSKSPSRDNADTA
jgi:hypothetical protein